MAFHTAGRTLSDPKLCYWYNDYAKQLLIYYVGNMPSLYKDSEMVFNTHVTIHLADEVKIHGPLEGFSFYPYKNFLFRIKQLIIHGNVPLALIYNRLHEIKEAEVVKYSEKLSKNKYNFGPKKERMDI